MTRPRYTAPGSIFAHDQLREHFTLWKLAEAAWDADQSPLHAQASDAAYLDVVACALNCGMPASQPNVREWVSARLAAYRASIGA